MENNNQYEIPDVPLNERLVYDTISNAFIPSPRNDKIYQNAFFSDKLKEMEVNLKANTDAFVYDINMAMKKTAEFHKITFNNNKIDVVYKQMMKDFFSCASKLNKSVSPENYSYKTGEGIADPLKYASVIFTRYVRNIDVCINKCLAIVKSVDATEDVLNKANYTSILLNDDSLSWMKLSEEQEKLYKSGKDIFSKESFMLNIKKLRTFKARVVRIFNKAFGKDSIFAPFNLHDICK